MARSKYEIAIETTYRGKGAKEASRDMKKLDDNTQDAKQRLTSFATEAAVVGAVLVGAGLAAKKAYEFIGEGAELSAAQGKFDNLAVSIGTVGDVLLGKMKVATKGMISDANLVASGMDIMSLGLAKTEDGVIRMATAVGALDLDMQVLALTLANDSTMRLDNLGLSLETVTKRKKELIASGFIGDAFDEAVLIELEQKMLLLGDASETTAGKMKILEAAGSTLVETLKQTAAESGLVVETFDRWANLATGLNAVIKAKTAADEDMNRAIALGLTSQEELNDIMGGAGYENILRRVRGELDLMTDGMNRDTDARIQAQGWIEQNELALRDEISARNDALESSERYIEVTAELGDKVRQQSSAITQLEADQRAAARATREHAEAAAALIAEAEKVSILDTYAEALGKSGEAAQTAAGRQDVYRDSLEDLRNNADVAASRVKNLAMKLLGIPASTNTKVNVDFGDAFSKLDKLTSMLGSRGAAMGILAEGDDIFAGNSSVSAGGPGGFQGQTAGGGFAGASSGTQSTPQLLAEENPVFGGPGFAHGVNKFMVPSGFPNDSFPIRVSSKEEVTVRTPQQQQSGGGGNTFNFYGMDLADVRNLLQQEGISADSRRRMN